jgi:hypothetical protein
VLIPRLLDSRPAVWISAVLVPASLIVVAWTYYPALLDSGTLPSDGDSIGIPIFETMLSAAIYAPMIAIVTWLALRGYNGGASLLGWDSKRWLKSAAVTIPCAAGASLALWDALRLLSSSAPWYEFLWLLVNLSVVIAIDQDLPAVERLEQRRLSVMSLK